MLLCLDVGNSQIFGGVFSGDALLLRFRRSTRQTSTSDELGVFLKNVLRENHISESEIQHISICSVVPHLDYSLRAACLKYFNINPYYLDVSTCNELQIKYRNPLEIGADRMANALAAIHEFPHHDMIIVDLGTATTVCAISRDHEYLGGSIMAGIRICMESLQAYAAKLPSVEIIQPSRATGLSTVESIQSGLYYSQLGGIKEIILQIKKECFTDASKIKVIGTGGFASLFENNNIFSIVRADLVLEGLKIAYLTHMLHPG